MARPSHRIKNLQSFLDRVDIPISGASPWGMTLTLFVGVPLLLILITNLEDGGPLMWFLAGLVVALGALITVLEMRAQRKYIKRKKWSPEALQIADEFRSLHQEGSLEERLDPAVGDELDACASAYTEIGLILDRPEWREAEGHRLSAKTSVLNAVDALIGDALIIAGTALRSKGMRRDSYSKRMEDPEVRDPMMESLRRVRQGLESLRSELGSHPVSANSSLTELESALGKLNEIRAAEEELHQSIRS